MNENKFNNEIFTRMNKLPGITINNKCIFTSFRYD